MNSVQPDASSQDEINAANQQKGKSTAPDVFALAQSVALANTEIFAPYRSWQVLVLPEHAVAGYYYQAINKDAPHPAAARLWQEFLYSDECQNPDRGRDESICRRTGPRRSAEEPN